MRKPRSKGLSNRQIEHDLDQMMRRKTWLVPTTMDQVHAAESVIEQTKLELPSSLSDPKTLRSRLRQSVEKDSQRRIAESSGYWTHESVLTLGESTDPIKFITDRARGCVFDALEAGWTGPPYDPFSLAEFLKIKVVPTQEVVDARTKANASGNFVIEFNPNRPPARIRYSIAHEIGHTLFPDCAKAIRNRATHEEMVSDQWQLEMLCNMAAAEILMPVGSLSDVQTTKVTVDAVPDLRKKYDVSPEAVLLRLTRLTRQPCFVFAARREQEQGRYYIDYALASRSWRPYVQPGFLIPKSSRAGQITAIGYTRKARECWLSSFGEWDLEYLGIPPYPGQLFPRVIGIATPVSDQSEKAAQITVIKGDATQPDQTGQDVIVQLVNDRALTWGAGFARAVGKKWPAAQADFTQWVLSLRSEFRLGAVHFSELEPTLYLASLVAQHGYGTSPTPRIRYGALATALEKLAKLARERGASLHMPKIGSGQAGGNWEMVSTIIEDVVCGEGVNVFVYDLVSPHAAPLPQQKPLF